MIAWVAVVVPSLVGLLVMVVINLPSVVRASVQTLVMQVQTLQFNVAQGDLARATLGVVAVITVALIPLGLAVVSVRLSRQAAVTAWTATDGSPGRRGAIVLASVGLLGAVVPRFGFPQGDLFEGSVAKAAVAGIQVRAKPDTRVAHDGWVRPAPLPVPRNAAPPLSPAPTIQLASATASPTRLAPAKVQILPAASQTLVIARAGDDWPFPFAPPRDARPGDNVVLVVNTQDHTLVVDFVTSLTTVTGDTPVDMRNVAMAASRCSDCGTLAVAFQVVISIGDVGPVVPVNEAIAVNYECHECATGAVAVQVVMTVMDDLPRKWSHNSTRCSANSIRSRPTSPRCRLRRSTQRSPTWVTESWSCCSRWWLI